jgi:hypothetical protein
MKNAAADAARRLLGNFTSELPYAAGLGHYMVLPRVDHVGARYLVLPQTIFSRRRTRWPNREWSGPNAKLNRLGLMDKQFRQVLVLLEIFNTSQCMKVLCFEP